MLFRSADNSQRRPITEGWKHDDDRSNARWEEKTSGYQFYSPWNNAEYISGADGKTRRVKPGVRLLVNGVPARVGRLRAYGNAIVPQIAAEVIKAFMETQ